MPEPWGGCATTNMRHGVGPTTTIRLRGVRTTYETVMQSFGLDNTRREIYTTQVIESGVQLADEDRPYSHDERSARGDLVFTRHGADGAILGRMWARRFGHGNQMAVEVDAAGVAWIWTGTEGSLAELGSNSAPFALSRIRFKTDTILESDDLEHWYPDGTPRQSTYPAVDPTTGTFMAKWWDGTTHRARLYPLAEAAANVWNPLAEIVYREGQTPEVGPSTAQGFQTFNGERGWYYVLHGKPAGEHAWVAVYSWRTGQLVENVRIQGARGITYREPEGMAVYQPDPANAPEQGVLWHGFAEGASGARRAVFCQFGTVCTNTAAPCAVTDGYE